MDIILKYPRTHHIEGSRFQEGDEELDNIPFNKINNSYLVVEEKVDGANCGISFSDDGELLLQSRGHFLTGGAREKHFNLFKTWANIHVSELFDILSNRYIMYGEWLYAKHTMFYDKLPHYFMEFDIFDKEEKFFLSTKKRKELLSKANFISSVFIIKEGYFKLLSELTNCIGKSNFISENIEENLRRICNEKKLDFERVYKETDLTKIMEGLYIKEEDENKVVGRYKYVRRSFLNNITNSESHWLDRPIIPNILNDDVNIYE